MKQYFNTIDICRYVGISKTTAWRLKRDGRWIPQPPTMFHSRPMWSTEEVEEWKNGLKLATHRQPTLRTA